MEKELSDKLHGGDNDFESLMEQSLRAPRAGDVLTGTVLLITRDSVIIDINYKCEGQVPLAEFLDHEGNPVVREGDEVDVYFEGTETENGTVTLSHAKAEKFKVWRELDKRVPERSPGRGRDPRQGQGRPAGRHRCAGLSAGLSRRHPAGPQSGSLRRPARALPVAQVQPRARQRGGLAPRRDRARAHRTQGTDPQSARRGRDPRRRGQEHHRLRRLRRPRRARRPVAHHRHVVGPPAASVRGRSRLATRSRWWCSSTIPRASACRLA
jgi:hypothetical protein